MHFFMEIPRYPNTLSYAVIGLGVQMNSDMYCWLHYNMLYSLIHTIWAVSFGGWSCWLSVSCSCHHYQCQLLGLVPKELYWSKKALSGLCLKLDLIKNNRACLNFPTMWFFTGISRNTQSNSYYAIIDGVCLRKIPNHNALWYIH